MEFAEQLLRDSNAVRKWAMQSLFTQLDALCEGAQIQKHWEYLEHGAPGSPWREVADEFTGDPAQFKEQHYSEFVTFLPYVQRFLYGEGKGAEGRAPSGESPIRVFRRADVARVRLTYKHDEHPLVFDVAHIDLYFFYDIDIVILAVEVFADDLSLYRAQDTLYRFGRAYPPYWDLEGMGGHCLQRGWRRCPTGASRRPRSGGAWPRPGPIGRATIRS